MKSSPSNTGDARWRGGCGGVGKLFMFFLLPILMVGAWAQEPTPDPNLEHPNLAHFERQRATLETAAETQRKKLKVRYLLGLEGLENQFTTSGDLDSLLAVREESERFGVSGTLDERDIVKTVPALGRGQAAMIAELAKVERQRAAALQELQQQTVALLEQQQRDLVKEGRIDEAVELRQVIAAMKGDVRAGQPPRDGWHNLCPPGDLGQWVGSVDQAVWEGGAFTMTPKTGLLHSRQVFGDFALQLDYKLSPGGSGSVGVYALDPDDLGLKVHLLDDAAHAQLPPEQRNGSLGGMAAPAVGASVLPGTWNHLEYAVRGDNIRVRMNGRVIHQTTFSEVFPNWKRRCGSIVLGVDQTSVQFRNIHVSALGIDASMRRMSAEELQRAIEVKKRAKGGKLRPAEAAFEAQEGDRLRVVAPMGANHMLQLQPVRGDFAVAFDLRADSIRGISLATGPESKTTCYAKPSLASDRWTSCAVRRVGDWIVFCADGRALSVTSGSFPSPPPGELVPRIVLDPGDEIFIRNFRLGK